MGEDQNYYCGTLFISDIGYVARNKKSPSSSVGGSVRPRYDLDLEPAFTCKMHIYSGKSQVAVTCRSPPESS